MQALPMLRRSAADTTSYVAEYLTRSVRRASGFVLADHPGSSEASRESVTSTWFSHLIGSDVTSELRTEKC